MKFNSTIYERGRKYFQQGKVRNVVQTNDGYEADVMGSFLYHVSASLKNGKVTDMECDCPHAHSGNNCKHEAALYIHILNEAKNKKLDNAKKSIKDEVELIYKNSKSSNNGHLNRMQRFFMGMDELFGREKADALKKFDKDVFNRWFDYIDKAYLYIQQNYWYRSYWLDDFSSCVDELIKKNEKYKKMYIQTLANDAVYDHCKALIDYIEGSIDELNSEDKLFYEIERLKQITDEKLVDEELFNILLEANHKGSEQFMKCLECFKEFRKYESYQYFLIVCSQEDQGKQIYEDYKKAFGDNVELEAILYKEETKKKAFYNNLAFHMEYKNKDLISLSNLIRMYGNEWIDVCEEFYLFLKSRLPKKQVDSIIRGMDDFQYIALQMMNFSGTRLNEEYMQVIYKHDKDLYKNILLQNFIRAIEKADKNHYYWFDNIYRDFNYSNSNADVLEALSYAKQFFKDNSIVIKEIDNCLKRYL